MIHKSEFAYITGLIRILETRLLNQNELERMIDAKTFQDAYRVMNELDYSKYLDLAKTPGEFQVILDADLKATHELLTKKSPYPWILDIFWYRYDIHNLKTIIKAKVLEKDLETIRPLLMPLGSINIDHMMTYVRGEKVITDEKNSNWKQLIDSAMENFETNGSVEEIDYLCDSNYFQKAGKLAKKSGVPFLKEYVQTLIDVNNIKTYLRIQQWEKSENDNMRLFHLGGSVPMDTYNMEQEKWLEKMKYTAYSELITEALKDIENENSFVKLENDTENFIANFVKKYRFEAFGPEVVFNYIIAKKNNAMTVRMVLIGKMNNIEPHKIRNRAQKLYNNI
jgi:V/A-type H+-transporting ATPase subunit C